MRDLERLWQAQNLKIKHKQLKEKARRESNLPLLKKEKAALEARLREYKRRKNRLQSLEKEVKARELDCEELSAKLETLTRQLYDDEHNNSKELQGIEQKIRMTKEELSQCEEAVLNLIQEQEELTAVLRQEKEALGRDKKDYEERVRQYQSWKESINNELAQIEAQYRQLLDEIDPELKEIYNRKSKLLGDTVVAVVENATCSGCRLDISPVVLKVIKKQNLSYCENCGRLLLYRED